MPISAIKYPIYINNVDINVLEIFFLYKVCNIINVNKLVIVIFINLLLMIPI